MLGCLTSAPVIFQPLVPATVGVSTLFVCLDDLVYGRVSTLFVCLDDLVYSKTFDEHSEY